MKNLPAESDNGFVQTSGMIITKKMFLPVKVYILVLAVVWSVAAQGGPARIFLGFAAGDESSVLPEGWEHLTYIGKNENGIALAQEGSRTVVHMTSLHSVSALLKQLNVKGESPVDPAEYPVLVWCWKVSRSVGMAIENRKDRNDSAARVRVIFGPGQAPVVRSPEVEKLVKYLGLPVPAAEPAGFKIDYIWGTRAAQGEILEYPGKRNHKMLVVQRGDDKASKWIWEQRNLVDDFRQCFNADPPEITAVAVLTDTDQTNEGVEAWYSSLVLLKE